MTQGKNESLRQYMGHFAKACLNIPNLHPVVAMHALIVGLKLDLFLNTLFAEPPLNIDELRARAAKYITIEENTEAARRIESPWPLPQRERESAGSTLIHHSMPVKIW